MGERGGGGGDEVSELAFLNAFANRGKRRELDYQVEGKICIMTNL